MKNLLFGFLLGIVFLKASHSYYSYELWMAATSLSCRIESKTEGGASKCLDRKIGNAKYFTYIDANFNYIEEKWELGY